MRESNTRKPKIRKKIKINCFGFPKTVVPKLIKAGRLVLSKSKIASSMINIILVPDEKIKNLNKTFRKVNRVTDVISFKINSSPLLGDIYIAKERSIKQSKKVRHSWEKELIYLVLHGVLHLLDYRDYALKERSKMFSKQDKIFQCLFS